MCPPNLTTTVLTPCFAGFVHRKPERHRDQVGDRRCRWLATASQREAGLVWLNAGRRGLRFPPPPLTFVLADHVSLLLFCSKRK